jgi:hypothetical protein
MAMGVMLALSVAQHEAGSIQARFDALAAFVADPMHTHLDQ